MNMKNLKIICLLLVFTGFAGAVNAQSGIIAGASQLYTSFKFTDSQGNNLNAEYSGLFTGSYGIGYEYLTNSGFVAFAGVGMRKAGATLVYDDINYFWDIQYADVKLGCGYVLKKDVISPYLNVAGYYAYMLRGFQTINNENFNLKYSGSLSETDFGIFINPGVRFAMSDAVSLFAEGNYMMGLMNLEKTESQTSANYAYGVTAGIIFSISEFSNN